MKKLCTINIEQACNLAVQAAIGKRLELPGNGVEKVARIFDHLGYVQIDTLQVIQRAHHHVLWTRFPGYKPEYLDLLLEQRKIFEYWTHALAYVPMKDYRFYLTRMRAFYDPYDKWEKDRIKKYGHLLEPVKNILKIEGALSASQIENKMVSDDPRSIRSAMDMLFFRGEVMITRRDGFKKIYDLAERVLPANINLQLPNERELTRFYIQRAIQTLGIANKKEMSIFLGNVAKENLLNILDEVEAEKIIYKCKLETNKGDYYTFPEAIDRLNTETTNRCFVLSPFDPLIIQRDRLKKIFGFDYRLECYVPPDKRIHGYFVLPILWQNRFVGRLDPKVDRKNKIMRILNLFFEDGFMDHDLFIPEFANELVHFADFHGCSRIIIENINTKKLIPFYRSNINKLTNKIELA